MLSKSAIALSDKNFLEEAGYKVKFKEDKDIKKYTVKCCAGK